MMKPIIKVENLGKEYHIGLKAEPYSTVRESLVNAIRRPLNAFRDGRKNGNDRFWALKDVNFEVHPGEVVGIIGRNGAGKSTLLKVLSRITEPTTGRVELYGRVGSLLEVGTGFHPELTGRENIYLNGAILGMRHEEIAKKFDEIVDFAEIDEFLDTPVKRYSSGMYVRLAFAVAAHLEPEILIVDEVLAVGDAQFQKKCLKKMQDVGHVGRTVIFVSHDMQAMSRLCERIVWLKDGEVVADGDTQQIISAYLSDQASKESEKRWDDAAAAPGNDVARLRGVRICDENGETVPTIAINQSVGVEMTYEVLTDGSVLSPNCHFYNAYGVCLFVSTDLEPQWRNKPKPIGTYRSTAWVPANFFSDGAVFVTAALTTFKPFIVHFVEWDVVGFQIVDSFNGDTARGDFVGQMPGLIRPILNWETSSI